MLWITQISLTWDWDGSCQEKTTNTMLNVNIRKCWKLLKLFKHKASLICGQNQKPEGSLKFKTEGAIKTNKLLW